MKRIIPVLIFLCAVAACEKDFIIPEQFDAKGMVINSMFSDAAPMQVYVTKSYTSSGTNNVQALIDAQVDLYEDGAFKEKLTYTPSDTTNSFGSYKSVLVPTNGKKYSIRAVHSRYGTATSEDEMPLRAEVVSHQVVQYPDSFNYLRDAIFQFRLRDDGAEENFYRLNVWTQGVTRYIDFHGDTIEREEFMGMRCFPVTPLTDTVRESRWFLLFSDKNFNGQEKELQFNFPAYPSDYFISLRVWVEIQTVSKSYYEYNCTLELARNNDNSAAPVNVFNNIQNGYGIFAGGSIQQLDFPVR